MAKFSVNDKVSFINEKQDGVIKSIKPSGICVVEIEDGFTIDALESELVLIKNPVSKPLPPEKKAEVTTPVFIPNLPSLTEGIWLISCPAVSGQVTTGPADLYLVNKSGMDALVACSWLRSNKLHGITSAVIPAGTQLYLATLKREEAFDKGDIYIQLLWHRSGDFQRQPALTREIPVLFPELASAFPSLPSPYAFCRLHAVSLPERISDEQADALHAKFSGKDIEHSITGNKPKQKQEKSRQQSYFEVDLHIEEITENFSGMSNSEMISMQVNYFRKKLDEALLARAYKIIFIHGVGNGRLKTAVRKELADQGLKFNDGSYERYGGGATEVVL